MNSIIDQYLDNMIRFSRKIILYQNKFHLIACLFQAFALLWLPFMLMSLHFSKQASLYITLIAVVWGVSAILIWRFFYLLPEKKVPFYWWYCFFLPAFCWQAGNFFVLPLAVLGLLLQLGSVLIGVNLAQSYFWVVTLICGLIMGIYATLIARFNVKVRKYDLNFPSLPESFNQFKIVHLSDLHIGNFAPEKYLKRCIQMANKQEPDAIIITGDIITFGDHFIPTLLELLGQLKAKHGLFFCLGNHDYYCDVHELLAGMKHIGIHILENAYMHLEKNGQKITLLGISGIVDNLAVQQRLVENVLNSMGQKKELFKILLAHDPTVFPASEKNNIALTLSGHTHSGQIALPFFPEFNMAARRYPWNRGIYKLANSVLHVSAGVGSVGVPLRLGAYPEVNLLVLGNPSGAQRADEGIK